jgi:hypothetical protein
VTPCRYCVNRRFGGTYRLHLQGITNPRGRNQREQVAAGCRVCAMGRLPACVEEARQLRRSGRLARTVPMMTQSRILPTHTLLEIILADNISVLECPIMFFVYTESALLFKSRFVASKNLVKKFSLFTCVSILKFTSEF